GLIFNGRLETLAAAIELTLALGGTAEEALERVLRAQSTTTLARMLETETVRATDVPGAGEVVLVYVPTALRSHVFCVTDESVMHARIEGQAKWAPLRDQFREHLLQSPVGLSSAQRHERAHDIDAVSRALASHLIPTLFVAPVATASKLSVIGVDLLGWIPFEALPVGGDPLGLTHAIAYAPSFSVQAFLRARRASRSAGGGCARIVAAPHQSAQLGLPELSIPPAWGEVITELSPETALVTGRAATFEGAVRACDEIEVLQLVAHGVRGRRVGNTAGLALTPSEACSDGLVFADDWMQSSLPPVVLVTVCGSWRGAYRVGDGGAGEIATSMILGGADCVAVTRADLSYGAALALSAEFHRAAATGVSPAEALRQARRALASSPDFSDPHFTSTMHFVGAAHESRAITPSKGRDHTAGAGIDSLPSAIRWTIGLLLLLGCGLALAWVLLRSRRAPATR
ncbi:MAG: CHAT domain-containing protein, partial [Planctomycetota bacterium]